MSEKFNINKNISVWRGDSTPPTDYHVWIKSDGTLLIKVRDSYNILCNPNVGDIINVSSIKEDYEVTLEDALTWLAAQGVVEYGFELHPGVMIRIKDSEAWKIYVYTGDTSSEEGPEYQDVNNWKLVIASNSIDNLVELINNIGILDLGELSGISAFESSLATQTVLRSGKSLVVGRSTNSSEQEALYICIQAVNVSSNTARQYMFANNASTSDASNGWRVRTITGLNSGTYVIEDWSRALPQKFWINNNQYFCVGEYSETTSGSGGIANVDLSVLFSSLEKSTSETSNTISAKIAGETKSVELTSATSSEAGLMSAEDETKLDTAYTAITELDLTLYRVVLELPTEDIEENKIYLVANSSASEEGNVFIEYVYVNGAWEELGEFKPEIDLSPYLTIEDAESTYATQETVNAVAEVIYQQFSSLSLSSSSTIIERGVDTAVTISWTFTFNSASATPDTISVTSGSNTLISDTSVKSVSDTINSTTSYSATATYNGVTKTASRTVSAYYPMYFGSSANTTLEESDILAMTKQSIKSSPSGTYSITVGQGEYLWLCVPSTMSISSVTSSGFEVPMESYITVTVTDKTDYRCYRSTSSFNEGTVSIVIS